MKPQAALLTILLCGCGDPESQPAGEGGALKAPATSGIPEYCGGEAGLGEIDAYFTRLATHLDTGSEPVPMEFYGETFSVRSENRRLNYRRTDIRPGSRALPSLEDWRAMSRQAPGALQDAGWRGCFLAHGKAWFEADGRGGFGLTSFDKTMPWSAPPSS